VTRRRLAIGAVAAVVLGAALLHLRRAERAPMVTVTPTRGAIRGAVPAAGVERIYRLDWTQAQ
jgi:hypothetical protein